MPKARVLPTPSSGAATMFPSGVMLQSWSGPTQEIPPGSFARQNQLWSIGSASCRRIKSDEGAGMTGRGSPSGNVLSDARDDEVERLSGADRGEVVVFSGAPSRPPIVIAVSANSLSAPAFLSRCLHQNG